MLQRDELSSQYYIRSYENNSLQLFSPRDEKNSQQTFETTILISNDQLLSDKLPIYFKDLDSEIFKHVETLDVEILLIGTGMSQKFPPLEIMKATGQYGFSVDYMDTGAASRTFNILANEERRVAALLFV